MYEILEDNGYLLHRQLASKIPDSTVQDKVKKLPMPGAIPMFGAAMAAATARQMKSSKSGIESSSGIAEMAAAAASKKSRAKKTDDDVAGASSLAPSGIAGMAAATALKRKKDKVNRDSGDTPISGGIAAMAAAAASKKSQAKKADDNVKSSSSLPQSGIAGMAAAAALKRNNDKVKEDSGDSRGGGIAAMAAAAALKNSQAKNANNDVEASPSSLPPSGIAGMAAAAALKRNKDKVKEESSDSSGGGGIAAMAATAALKKSQAKEVNNDVEASSSLAPPGIAGMAAAAALKRNKDKFEEDSVDTPMGGGGIAAMAAAAALKKSQAKEANDDVKGPSSLPQSGLAGMAAAAALKRNKEKVNEGNDVPRGGGIAAMAAAAALKKSQAKEANDDVMGSSSLPSSGIAGMAAAAALKRNNENVNENNGDSRGGGGIAAMAAAAALKKSQLKEADDDNTFETQSRSEEIASVSDGFVPRNNTDKNSFQKTRERSQANEDVNHLSDKASIGTSMNSLMYFTSFVETFDMFEFCGIRSLESFDNMLFYAESEISENNVDSCAVVCIYNLIKAKIVRNTVTDLERTTALKLLNYSVSLCDRAKSKDKWIKYYNHLPIDKTLDRPLLLLLDGIWLLATIPDWSMALSSCWSLYIRCEHEIPSFDPLSIIVKLYLAGLIMKVGDGRINEQSTRLFSLANDSLSIFLAKQESEFQLSLVSKTAKRASNQRARRILSLLRIYVKKFLRFENSEMHGVFGKDHPSILWYHSFLGKTHQKKIIVFNSISSSNIYFLHLCR